MTLQGFREKIEDNMSTKTVPLIGFTTYREDVTWGVRGGDSALTQAIYFELAAAAGGRPVLLPPVRHAPGGPGSGAAETIAALDGLVIIGGLDVDPSLYGAVPDPSLGRIDPSRDASEVALLSEALACDLPVLAICRGLQLLNVVLGGTLFQHLPDVIGHDEHQPGDGQYAARSISCLPGTRTAAIFGEHPVVQCSHHQAIDRLGEGLVVTASSVEENGTTPLIEAVERVGSRFCLGVQWHPEKDGDQRPFDALIQSC